MSKKLFTSEQVKYLNTLNAVKKVTIKSITYTPEFKKKVVTNCNSLSETTKLFEQSELTSVILQ